MTSKVIIILIKFTFLSIDMFWAFRRAHFMPRLEAWAKMSRAQLNITVYAREHKPYNCLPTIY